ncbi:MAG: aminopeptidase, partial [Candidatus Diapherotrites archaeon]|nr:aminopeptidase [Candidatus Diapherotrites archaeon]
RYRAHAPVQAAAYGIVKHMARSQTTGEYDAKSHPRGKNTPIQTASVLLGKKNIRFGKAIAEQFRQRGARTRVLNLSARKYPDRVLEKSARANAVFFTANDSDKHLERPAEIVVDSVEKRYKTKSGSRMALLYGMTPQAVREVLSQNTKRMRRFTQKTFDAVQGAKRIHVKTPAGTDLVFDLTPKHRWVQDNGVLSKNYWGNLPAGEVFTSPASVNGNLVIDGVMYGVGMLNKTPLTVKIVNGRVDPNSIRCQNPVFRERLLKIIKFDANASRIGELGLGTNVGVTKLTGNDLVDEKYVGVHVAVGDALSADTGATWTSEEHRDAVLRKPTIFVDGRCIMRNGKSLL